jgi:Domain of unknown function (DUF4266)
VYNGSGALWPRTPRDMVATFVRYLTRLAVVLLTISASGCVVVKANQRGNLAKRAMTNDRDAGEARFGQHERGSREGADGGTGQPGGGCGCN